MMILRAMCVFTLVGLLGCGSSSAPTQPQATTTQPQASGGPNSTGTTDERVVAELRRQNELLEAQTARQKAEDAAKAEADGRDKHIDDVAGRIAKLVNDHAQEVAGIVKDAGGIASIKSQYNDLYNELRTTLKTATAGIKDDAEFRSTVEATAKAWATKKALGRN